MFFQEELETRIGYRILKVLFIFISLIMIWLLVFVHNDDILSIRDGVLGWIVLVIVYKVLIYIFFGKNKAK